jgi:hypothetical protein
MVNVAGRESTGAVARVPFVGIFLPVLPAAGALSETNRICEPMSLVRPGAAILGPAGLASLIANRANMIVTGRAQWAVSRQGSG